MRRLLQCLLLGALALTVYYSTLQNSWHFDDHHSILQNSSIRSLKSIPSFFTNTATFTGNKKHTGSMYRPLLLVGYALTYYVGGYSLPIWHCVQISLHILVLIAVFWLFRLLDIRDELALLACALFAIHPIQSHAVNYLCSRSEIQASLFYLLALIAFIYSTKADGTLKWVLTLFGPAMCLAALLTKTIAITIPAVIILWDLWLGPAAKEKELKDGIKASLIRATPFILTAFAYLILRKIVTGGVVLGTEGLAQTGGVGLRLFRDGAGPFTGQTMGSRSVYTNFLVQVCAFWKYLWLFLWPPALSIVHEVNLTPSLFSWPTLPALVCFVFMVGTLLYCRKVAPLLSFSGLFTLLIMAPTSLIPLNLPMNEHRLYLASVGVFLIAASALLRAFNTPRSRRALPLMVAATVTLFSTATLERNRQWSSPLKLWSDAVVKAPTSRYAHLNYANALYEAGDESAALWHGEKTLSIFPAENPVLWARHARLHIGQGNLLLAKQYLQAALDYDGESLDLLTLRVDLLIKMRRPKKAIQLLTQLEQKGAPSFRRKMKNARLRLEKRIREIDSLIQKTPRGVKRAKLFLLAGQLENALNDLGHRGAWRLRGEILLRLGCYQEAAQSLRYAIFEQAVDMLVVATVASGKEAEGRRLAQKALANGVPLSLEARFYARLAPYTNKS